jgi:twitching motility protein PilT
MANLHQLLKAMIEKGASDLHITTQSPPQLRIDGKLHPLKMPPLTPPETKQLCYSILTDAQKHRFEESNELDLSFGVRGLSRFRANIFTQRGAVAGAFRAIPYKIMTFEELGLATMIDKINTERNEHIVTVEDPIEYLHPHKGCVVNQREVGADTSSFKNALKYILRQDPDVVLIGEMRDLETIEAALTVAETGHLAFATLHTNSCVQTMNRVIDVFPPYQQAQVRAQLSFVLEGVLSQTLIPRANGPGRVLALEIMVPNPAIRNLIREDKIHQIYSQMQIGQEKFGMQTMNQSLVSLFQRRMISMEDALGRSSEVDELKNMLAQGNAAAGRRPGGA